MIFLNVVVMCVFGLQFALGRRDCVGRNFAMLEGMTILAMLMRRYTFELAPGYELVAEEQGFVQGPKGGLLMCVKSRSPTP